MTNPNDAVGTNAAYGGRTSVNAFNDSLGAFTRGILSGWGASAGGGMSVDIGGDGTTRDIAVAVDNIGNKTTVNNISGSPINVPIATAPASNSRIDAIVVYVDNPASGVSTVADNPSACGIIAVEGTPAASPTAPTDADIRTAITADGASGSTAYYAVIAQITVAANVTVIDAGAISQLNNLYATVGQDNFRTSSINGSKLQDLSITNSKIGGAAVKSSNIDFTTLWSYFSKVAIPWHNSGGNSTAEVDITDLPEGAKVLVTFAGYWYLQPGKEGYAQIRYNSTEISGKHYANNATGTSASLGFSVSVIVTKVSGVNKINCFEDCTGSTSGSNATVTAIRVG